MAENNAERNKHALLHLLKMLDDYGVWNMNIVGTMKRLKDVDAKLITPSEYSEAILLASSALHHMLMGTKDAERMLERLDRSRLGESK